MSHLNQTVSEQGRSNISKGRKAAYKRQDPATRAAQKAGQSRSYRKSSYERVMWEAKMNKAGKFWSYIVPIMKAWLNNRDLTIRLRAVGRVDVNYITGTYEKWSKKGLL